MATVDGRGVTLKGLDGFRMALEDSFHTVFGADMSVDTATRQGQEIGLLATALAEAEEPFSAVFAEMSYRRSTGLWLEAGISNLGFAKQEALKSIVMATLTGTANTIIPVNSRARTDAGAIFQTTVQAAIGDGGTIVIPMESVESGSVEAAAGTLTTIISGVAGWTSIINSQDAVLGRRIESDADTRERYEVSIGRLGLTTEEALRAAVLLAGATQAVVVSNDENAAVTRQGLTIPANAVMCIVRGGVDQSIAETIANSKTLGGPTAGNTLVDGIRFQRVEEVMVRVALTITIGTRFPSDGISQIRGALVDYGRETFELGQPIDVLRLTSPINAVPGHALIGIPVVTDTSLNSLPTTPNLNVLYTLATSNIAITTA